MEETAVTTEPTRADRVKSFVNRHKVAITVVATSTVWIGINRIALKQHEDFIEAEGLTDKFHAVGEFEEL